MNTRIFIQLFCLVLPMAVPASGVDASPLFKIYVEHTGVYEVPFERLAEAGLVRPVATGRVGLTNRGQPVPVWVEDGGDGLFGEGDRLLFVGEVLRGEYSYLDPHSRFNCYFLDLSDPSPRQGLNAPSEADPAGEAAVLLAHHRLEPDRVMVRFRSTRDEPEEAWYWERLSVADKRPFRQVVALEGLARNPARRASLPTFADALTENLRSAESEVAADPSRIRSVLDTVFGDAPATSSVRFRIGLRGWSEPRHRERDSLPHHELEILLNGQPVGRAVWDGTEHYVHELEVVSHHFLDGDNELELKIPKRLYTESGDLVVDVVLLNWIELEYEHLPLVSNEQIRLRPADTGAGRKIEIRAEGDRPVDLYLPDGVRYRGERGWVTLELPAHVTEFSVLPSHAAAKPNEVVLDRPSDLLNRDRQADYIMITHRSLMTGAERLAEFHRSRGLAVEVVDVQDIYDEFNYGILAPEAIKTFLQRAHAEWRAPAPRFVALVGDASWDFKNTTADDANYADWTYRPGENRRFWKNRSTAYAEGAELNHRNLVPTSSFPTLEGHAASDTWFVCFDDGDNLPDMAIGRLPVVSLEELDGVIDKTIAFAAAPPVGPWRRNLLFIANESAAFQRRSDRIAQQYSDKGFVPTTIYPHPSEPANEHHTRRIIEILDSGVYAVHFIGHGGRYIWRTGPPDLEKNHDLFTLDHLDQLADNQRLPVVLSLTCYSGPFDHPTADSIGEKLLRIPERGAIAVFAASWRNSPSPLMGERLLAELTTPGNTIGEAVMRAKQDFQNQVLVQTYNLIGDPAVPVGAPAHTLDLELEEEGGGLILRATLPAGLDTGSLIADWVGVDGSTLREDRVAVNGTSISVTLDDGVLEDAEALAGVRVYVWDEEHRTDGIGWAAYTLSDPAQGSTATAEEAEIAAGEKPMAAAREIKGEL